MSANCEVIVIFSIYGKFGAIQKPDFGCIAYKTYFFIKTNLLKTENRKKISNTALTLLF